MTIDNTERIPFSESTFIGQNRSVSAQELPDQSMMLMGITVNDKDNPNSPENVYG